MGFLASGRFYVAYIHVRETTVIEEMNAFKS